MTRDTRRARDRNILAGDWAGKAQQAKFLILTRRVYKSLVGKVGMLDLELKRIPGALLTKVTDEQWDMLNRLIEIAKVKTHITDREYHEVMGEAYWNWKEMHDEQP